VDSYVADVALEISHAPAVRAQSVGGSVICTDIGEVEVKAIGREFRRDGISNATPGSRDEGYRFVRHPGHLLRRLLWP
jgi:hypothetical protein